MIGLVLTLKQGLHVHACVFGITSSDICIVWSEGTFDHRLQISLLCTLSTEYLLSTELKIIDQLVVHEVSIILLLQCFRWSHVVGSHRIDVTGGTQCVDWYQWTQESSWAQYHLPLLVETKDFDNWDEVRSSTIMYYSMKMHWWATVNAFEYTHIHSLLSFTLSLHSFSCSLIVGITMRHTITHTLTRSHHHSFTHPHSHHHLGPHTVPHSHPHSLTLANSWSP